MKRLIIRLLLALGAVMIYPRMALALGYTAVPNVPDGVSTQVEAAVYSLYYDWDTMPQAMKTLLMSSNTSDGDGTDSFPNFPDFAEYADSLHKAALGDGWYSTLSGTMYAIKREDATADMQALYRWWDLYGAGFEESQNPPQSGGVGGQDQMGEWPSQMTLNGYFGGVNLGSGETSSVSGMDIVVNFGSSAQSTLNSLIRSKPYAVVIAFANGIGTNEGNLRILLSNQPITLSTAQTATKYGALYAYDLSAQSSGTKLYTGNVQFNLYGNGGIANVNTVSTYNGFPSNFIYTGFWTNNASGGGFGDNGGGGAFQGGEIPEEPDPVEEPDPEPTYTDTDNITTTVDLEPVTSRLDVINDNLVKFYNHFHEYFDWWYRVVDTLLRLLQDYFGRILTWLQMIYNRMANVSVSPAPADDDSFWDWLGRLIDRLVGDLPSSTANFETALGQLTGKFPFSIPWDVAALLALFDASPVPPRFSITMPGFGDAEPAHVVVDLSQYADLASLCRAVLLVQFCLTLAGKTFETLQGMDWSLFD